MAVRRGLFMHSGECEYTLKKRLTLARLARLKMKNHIYLNNNNVIADKLTRYYFTISFIIEVAVPRVSSKC